MNQFQLDELAAFVMVVRLGGFSRAAEALYLSQPTISGQITRLERRLRIRLLERLPTGVHLTEPGITFYEYAERVLRLVEESRQAVQDASGAVRGQVSIAASTTIGLYLLPPVIARFSALYPEVELVMEVDRTTHVLEHLRRDAYDFGVVEGPVIGGEFEIEHFAVDELILVVSPQHPFAAQGAIEPEDLVEQLLILPRRGQGIQVTIQNALQQHGLHLRKMMEISHVEAIKRVVEAGLGSAFIPRHSITRELAAGTLVVVVVHELSLKRDLTLVRRHQKYLSMAARKLIEMLKAESNTNRAPR